MKPKSSFGNTAGAKCRGFTRNFRNRKVRASRSRFRRDAIFALLFSVVVAALCVFLFVRLIPERHFRPIGIGMQNSEGAK